MAFVIPEPPRPTVPVQGTDALFPVRRIYCVGRNYAAHAREMGADPTQEPPLFFSKPGDAVITAAAGAPAGKVPYPPATSDLHHEVELVFALGQGGRDLTPAAAAGLIYGCAVGVDLTRRDLQAAAKAKGHPWDMAKGFDHSAPLGPLVPVSAQPVPRAGRIHLTVDGEIRQDGDLADMIWDAGHLLAHLSRLVTLQPGDLVFTGTPEGVGPVARGQTVHAEVAGLPALTFMLT